jgi:2,4-dienoyl-CoA reductase-like NADH-dependent reductase (Old Yellow Enzyme family)
MDQQPTASAALFEPFTTGGVTLRNRVVVSPMCQYSSEDGHATDWHLVHLGSRAVGGSGAVIVEATAVEPIGRISPGDMGFWSESHIPMLSLIAKFVRSQGAAPGIQLAHAGRKASTSRPWDRPRTLTEPEGGWQPVAPSPEPYLPSDPPPRELSGEEIGQIVQKFADAARRAVSAGFSIIEIHAAHGYLLHEFLSPLSNYRGDRYGGSLENRSRALREVVGAIRPIVPKSSAMWVRLSATDWSPGGLTIDDSVQVSRWLKEAGVDLIDCSSGGNVAKAVIPIGPGYQVPLARQIRAEAKIATGAVGLITEASQAEEILRGGAADVVLLARQMLRDPYWAVHSAKKLGQPLTPLVPVQYLRAW